MDLKRYLTRLGWTPEKALERKNDSMQYAREVKNGTAPGHPSTKFLFVELARKYSRYYRILSS